MRLLYLLTVWLHILVAAAWIGAMFFLALVLIPSLRKLGDATLRASLLHESGMRLRQLGWATFATLAVTGVALVGFRGFGWQDLLSGQLWRGPFGNALAIKLILFGSIVAISFWHDFRLGPRATEASMTDPRSAEAERLRRLASWCGRFTLLLTLGVVALAVVLVRGWPI
ncbi:MAG: CopD family protein [Thermoanaerobaculia bacterium]|nr:CopD family protein [Thermoanaerobaculia bacterium]